MFKEVKIKLAAMFTAIVAGLQFLFSFGFLLHQAIHYGMPMGRIAEYAVVLIAEIAIISVLTFAVGYFFVRETVRPAEDMFERLDQFTIDASHELKTPLGIANSALDLALRTKKYPEYIKEAKTYIKRAADLVEKMLELARLDSLSMAPAAVSVQDILKRVLSIYEPEIKKKHIQVIEHINGEAKPKADMVLLERAVSNLIENAIKFNQQNGRIEINLNRHKLVIANTGKQVPKEELARLFDRFYQSDMSRSAKGYGIGLAIVKKICDLHGWKVCVESTKETTIFTIFFDKTPWIYRRQ